MNSISFLDSVLTRSLTSSRAASGSNTPTGDNGPRLNRRASDYSLARDRERRRVALSLGLTTLDSDQPVKRKKSSRRSSRKGSETEGGVAEPKERLTGLGHPKSASEGNATEGRQRRVGSTPAPLQRGHSSPRWGGLWGLGGWLEGSESHDSYSRRASLSARDGAGRTGRATIARRASTGDADAALAGLSPDSLLSERERENVVDFEGYDPDEDLQHNVGVSAPPPTPFPTTTSTTPTKQRSSREGSGMSTGSRLSSLLFGALNPLTDDYFGPQPSPTSTPPQQRRKKSDDGTADGERKRQKSHKSEAKAYAEKTAALLNVDARRLGEAAKEGIHMSLPSEPPPPYSDVAAVASSTSLLLPSPDLNMLRGQGGIKGLSRRRRAGTLVLRGLRGLLDFLRRLILTILLAPARLVHRGLRRGKQDREGPVQVEAPTQRSDAREQESPSKFQTASQAERPSAARHKAGRRSTAQLSEDDSSGEEVVTEEQAEEKARRKLARKAAAEAAAAVMACEEEAAVEKSTAPSTPVGSRLLPNPHPIDPLLAHDRNAKPVEQNASTALVQSPEKPKPISIAMRGPLSSLIHHTPKLLVLDLDETLIHSTSRSPTWGALADKSKGRMAVTTGGSLLGLEGLGGVMGLRGQVGVRPHQVEVVLDGRSIIYHVYKRPHVDFFLRKVAAWYHVVIFTASVQEYADPVIDWLDQGRGLVGTRLFRESCTFRNGSYLKNLAHVDADLSRVCLVDNSPASYQINQGEYKAGHLHTQSMLIFLLLFFASQRDPHRGLDP